MDWKNKILDHHVILCHVIYSPTIKLYTIRQFSNYTIMTIDNTDLGDSFTGVMKNLNLEETEYDRETLRNMTYPQLAVAKREIESTLESLFDLLKYKYDFDMHQPLVINGFPRNDVDVVTIRLIRTKIIRLRNDHTYVLLLLEVHLMQRLQNQNVDNIVEEVDKASPLIKLIPFAVIREVAPNGPAGISGLRPGDTVILFDTDIHAGNHNKLAAIAERVRAKVGQQIPVELLRGGQKESLTLVPTDNWGGRGLLGCHLVPF